MSGFGPAVIGEEAFKRQEKIREERSDIFGPAVRDPDFRQGDGRTFHMDPPEGTKNQPFPARIRPKDGERPEFADETMMDHAPAAPADPQEGAEPRPEEIPEEDQPYLMGVRDLKKVLRANPLLVDELMHAEIARPEGVRKTAIEEMLAAENRRGKSHGGPRQPVIESLESMLAQVLGDPDDPEA